MSLKPFTLFAFALLSRCSAVVKVIIAFAVLWGLDAAIYALVIVLTIETGTTILYVYFGIFVVLASLLTFAVLYGMRVREVEAEQCVDVGCIVDACVCQTLDAVGHRWEATCVSVSVS